MTIAELHTPSPPQAPAMDGAVLRAEGLKRYYRRGAETVKALDGIDLSIRKGELLAVVGPSGAGKTTLVNILSLLDKATEGTVSVGGIDVTSMSEDRLAEIRREQMGFIFQRFYLLPTLTVRENVEMPLTFSKKAATREATDMLLKLVGLSDRASHLPRELSGGQMQRVAIARSLVGDPSIIFADEPTGNLDSTNTRDIRDLLSSLASERGITVIVSTHDMEIADACHRVIHIRDGRVDRVDGKAADRRS